MNKIRGIIILILVLFCANLYAQEVPNSPQAQTKVSDVNGDGKADVTYHKDGEFIGKLEMDTNYDGRTDVVVNAKDGKFVSAQADTNHDGAMDKEFSDSKSFNEWLNANHNDFYEQSNSRDWDLTLMRF